MLRANTSQLLLADSLLRPVAPEFNDLSPHYSGNADIDGSKPIRRPPLILLVREPGFSQL
jgi:hypothetical protein